MNGLFFLLCCTEILGALVYGEQTTTNDRSTDESNNLSNSTTIPLTASTSFSISKTEASTAMSSTRPTTKVTSKSPSTSSPPVTESSVFHRMFNRQDFLPLLMVTGGLMILCTILLVSTLLLACKVCYLARRIKGLSSNSDLVSTEYWIGTDKKGKSKSEAEPKETTVLMADINETPAATGNGTKEEGGKVTEEGQMEEENKKEVGDATNGEEASAEPVADAEKSSPSKPQEEATDSQITKAATASTSEGTEEPKDVV